jgi:hypothetical protein
VGGVPAVSGVRDQVEAELVVRQGQSPFGPRPERAGEQVARGVPAAADWQGVPGHTGEGRDGAEVGVVEVEAMPARHAGGGHRGEGLLGGRGRASGAAAREVPSVEREPIIPQRLPHRQSGLPAQKKSGRQALGRSRGGVGTTVQAAVDGRGHPVVLKLTPGQAGDAPHTADLLAGRKPGGGAGGDRRPRVRQRRQRPPHPPHPPHPPAAGAGGDPAARVPDAVAAVQPAAVRGAECGRAVLEPGEAVPAGSHPVRQARRVPPGVRPRGLRLRCPETPANCPHNLRHKLDEAKPLPGLEASEDINVIAGSPVTHLTPDVMAKMDQRYGKGKWIIKAYGDDAAAG